MRLPRHSLLILLVLIAAIALYVTKQEDGGEADYQRTVDRFGAALIERMVTQMIPLGIAKECHDRYGENPVLIEAAAAYVDRTLPAAQALVDELERVGQMSESEKIAVETAITRRAALLINDRSDCERAAVRIAAGAFDPDPY